MENLSEFKKTNRYDDYDGVDGFDYDADHFTDIYNEMCGEEYDADNALERWASGNKNVSLPQAWQNYLDKDHVKVTPAMEKRLMRLAPDLVVDANGKYCGSPEVKMSFAKEGEGTQLVVLIGIHDLKNFKTPIKMPETFIDKYEVFCTQSLNKEDFEATKALFTTVPEETKIYNHASSDPFEAATEHAFSAATKIITSGTTLGHTVLCLKDPSPGAVVRIKEARKIYLSGKENANNDVIINRASETNMIIKPYKDNKDVTYYLGFFDHKIKPKRGTYCGFEINPYSRVLRASGRVITLQHFDDALGGGFRVVYFRKDLRVNHDFYRNPSYFRYKTRVTIPFFTSYNRNYEKCVTDQYLFYSSDPLINCFDNVNKCGFRKEAFPAGLLPLYCYDVIKDYPFSFCGVATVVQVMFQGDVAVDLKSTLSYFSRMKLLDMVLKYNNIDNINREKCTYIKMEHPISGDVYEMKKESFAVEICDDRVICLAADGYPTEVLVYAVKYRNHLDEVKDITKNDAFIYFGDGYFKHFRVYPSDNFGHFTLIKGYVPGCPVGFNVAGDGPVPLGKRKYYSCVMNVKSAVVWTQELIDWYDNLMFCSTRNYLPDRNVIEKVPFVKIGEPIGYLEHGQNYHGDIG